MALPQERLSSILDEYADRTHFQKIITLNGIPSMDFGFDEIFAYQEYDIPDLGTQGVYCFKVVPGPSGTTQIELRKTSDLTGVTALSYSWGQQLVNDSVQIGMYWDGRPCRVRIGLEWKVPTLIETLVQLSMKSWLWMDQVALQPDTTRAEIISTFATVYSRCPVVILFPGSECPVLQRDRRRILETKGLSYEDAKRELGAIVEHLLCCSSFDPNRRWFHRVWTRQEALYASCVRVVYVGSALDRCVPVSEDQAQCALELNQALNNLAEVLGTKMNTHDEPTHDTASVLAKNIIAQAAFLYGIQLVRASNRPSLFRSLNRLAETSRQTTDPCDLLYSVWPAEAFPCRRALSQQAKWDEAWENVVSYYKETFGAQIPFGLIRGAKNLKSEPWKPPPANPYGSSLNPAEDFGLQENREGLRPRIPSIRKLYGPFQLGQRGVAQVGSKRHLHVSDEKITFRALSYQNYTKEKQMEEMVRFTENTPVWILRSWLRSLICASNDPDGPSNCSWWAWRINEVDRCPWGQGEKLRRNAVSNGGEVRYSCH